MPTTSKLFAFLNRTRGQGTEVVRDLDALISTSRAFRFQGKVHVIKPIDQKTFIAASEAFARMDAMRRKDTLSAAELVSGYEALFSAVCDTITRKHVESMTTAQAGALYVEILSQVTGDFTGMTGLEKKKVLN